MKIFLLILFIAILCVISYCSLRKINFTYKKNMERNDEVYKFRFYIIDICCNTSDELLKQGKPKEAKRIEKLYNKYTYDDMYNSSKPLTIEEWYTEEEIKLMKGENL